MIATKISDQLLEEFRDILQREHQMSLDAEQALRLAQLMMTYYWELHTASLVEEVENSIYSVPCHR